MAANSFLVKGWSATLAAAIMAFSASVSSGWSMLAAVITSIAFWCLDAYFLRAERLYRTLYDYVRRKWPDGDSVCTIGDMDLSVDHLDGEVEGVVKAMGSWSVLWFHVPVTVAVVAVAFVLFL